jgi:TraX protein.
MEYQMAVTKQGIISRDTIKYFAMLTMLLNHIAQLFLPQDTIIHDIFEYAGYFTGITMCYFLVEGYSYTHSKIKYALRLLSFAFISEYPYYLAFGYLELNMLFTLFFCFLVVAAMNNIKSKALRILVIILLLLATGKSDWAYLAPIFTIMFVMFKNSKKRMLLGYSIAYILFCGIYILKFSFTDTMGTAILHGLAAGLGIAASAVAILILYNGQRAKRGRTFAKWFFYIFYPVHLFILGMIKLYV